MADKYFSMDNLRFLMYEVHDTTSLATNPQYAEYTRETSDMMLDAAKQLADSMLFPYFEEVDRYGSKYKDGTIQVHPIINKFMKAAGEGGWIGAAAPTELGGMQMPSSLFNAVNFLMGAANNSMIGYTGLTGGAAKLIYSFGTKEQQEKYIPKMFSGDWQGTMALTEPQAGSSLSDLTTSAKLMDDGSYRIKGQKIFISSGDYSGVENVVHLMLARIEGAPAGSKGISLFIVPKHRVSDDGSLTPNDVTTAGAFSKMGQCGYATSHLIMGEKDDCHGWLVGTENRGLRHMFQMMNGARISVGLTGASIASAAYYASLQYANERPQGRRITNRDLNKPQSLIIEHADVRRMLMLQKAIMEGSLSLLMECTMLHDRLQISDNEEEKEDLDLLLELLTPIAKTYPSEDGARAVSNGLQIFGGYGFCKDFPLEQLYRDIRICPLYEGTTGIQSMDLLGRKVTASNGKALMLLAAQIQKEVQEAMNYDELKPYAKRLMQEGQNLQEVTQHLVGMAMQGDTEGFLADANLYMELFSTNIMAWQWLKQANAAKRALLTENPQGDRLKMLEGKILSLKFYYKYELPKTLAWSATLKDNAEQLTIAKEEEVLC